MKYLKPIATPLILVVLVACSWLRPLDTLATNQVDAGLKRALVSFGTARSISALLSVAQGTQVAVEPAGVGVNFAPGQILGPVNDLVEQFSHLMLVASVSFGVQKVLISIGGHWLVSLLLTIAAVLWSFFHVREHTVPAWVSKILVVAIVLRLAVPAVTVGTDVLFQHFLAADFAASQKIMEAGATNVKKLNPPDPSQLGNQSLLDKLKGLIPQDLNISSRFDALLVASEQLPEQIIRQMVIFLLQTLIIPLTLLWGLVALASATLGYQSATVQKTFIKLLSTSDREVGRGLNG